MTKETRPVAEAVKFFKNKKLTVAERQYAFKIAEWELAQELERDEITVLEHAELRNLLTSEYNNHVLEISNQLFDGLKMIIAGTFKVCTLGIPRRVKIRLASTIQYILHDRELANTLGIERTMLLRDSLDDVEDEIGENDE